MATVSQSPGSKGLIDNVAIQVEFQTVDYIWSPGPSSGRRDVGDDLRILFSYVFYTDMLKCSHQLRYISFELYTLLK